MNSTIAYHLDELRIALDVSNPSRVLPELRPSDRVILDVGCGIGQSFLALDCTDRICIGMDIDEESISYGMKHHGDKVRFILGDATRIPMPSRTFDLVYSRVSLPYMNIPKVIGEIKRVLKVGGRVWMTLHSKEHAKKCIAASGGRTRMKQFIFYAYVMLNGYCLKYLGFLLPFTGGRYVSWQDLEPMGRLLARHGFEVRTRRVGDHTVVEGTLLDA